MDAQIAKTTQSLTTAAEMRETTKMLMKPNANWEEYLTPAPLSIAIMGQLVFISSCDDFSINNNPPEGGFKYIKYPNSFRACLMQICNSGWHAFNEAHNSMDQIRIHTSTVPDYMKTAVHILFNASDDAIQRLLPCQLENIQTIAEECVTLAGNVEKKYSDVIHLIQELLEACINAEHFYGEELEKVKRKLEETKLREEASTKLNDQIKKATEAMSKQMDEAQDAYKQSMDSLPSGWEMIGMDFVEGITSSVTGLMSGITSLLTLSPIRQLVEAARSSSSSYSSEGSEDGITQITVCSKSDQILKLAASLKEYVNGNEIDWKNLYDQKKKCPKSTWINEQFQRISEELKIMPKQKLREKALKLCKKGISICAELAKYNPGMQWDPKTTKRLIKDINELNNGALAFDSKSKAVLGSPALAPKPPMMFKEQNNSSEPRSASQRASENARFKIEQNREQLNQTRQSYQKCVENMERNQKELTDILVEMQNCKITEIDFDTKIKMLVKGLDAMGRVKEQWEKMVRFFQMVSNIVKTSLSKTLHTFVTTSKNTKELSYNDKLFAKDLLYNQAFQASNIASLVHMISETYTEVSNNYLMDRVSSLGRLMAMEKDSPQFDQERLNLEYSCQEAQDGILRLVLKNKREFERKTDDRMAVIERQLKAILPAALPQETEKIKEIVQAGFGEGEEDYY